MLAMAVNWLAMAVNWLATALGKLELCTVSQWQPRSPAVNAPSTWLAVRVRRP
jgi:hypothetical protein